MCRLFHENFKIKTDKDMTESHPGIPENISKEAVRGTFWTYLSFASGKFLNFVTTLILTRLLVPEEFGVVAYCTIAIQYVDILNSAGIDSALIARREKVEEAANSAFIANILLGIISFGAVWSAAPSIAAFFKEPQVTGLLRLLALALPISGLGLVPSTMILRGLKFRTKLIPDIVRSFSKGLISIVLAFSGYGAWSLIWGQLAGELAAMILYWVLAGWRPTWKFDREATRDVATFGGHIILVEIAGQLRNNIDYIIVGRILGKTLLGIYTLAYRIPELAIRSFDRVVGGVSFPLLAQVQTERETLRNTYLGYIRYTSLFTFSIGAGIAIISAPFVHTFLSAEWQETALPMALIAIALAISSVGHIPGIFYKAIGRPDILNRLSMIKLPVIVAILWAATRWGIVGVAVGQIIFAIFAMIFDSIIVSYIIRFNIVDSIKAIVPASLCAGAMALTTTLAKVIFDLDGLFGFTAILLIGGFSFIVALRLVDHSLTDQVLLTLKRKLIPVKTL
jgi:O-antigen/teichoic acid export membrane protein